MKKIIKRITTLFILLIPGFRWFYQFREANRQSFINAGIKKKVYAFRKGFTLESMELYALKKENVKEYLSDRDYLKLHPINKEYSAIIDNKFYLPFLFKDHPEIIPRYYFLIDKGRLIKIGKEFDSDQDIAGLCREKRKLVLKPCHSTYGQGFNKLEWKNNIFSLNNKIIEASKLSFFISSLDRYIVTEYIEQHKYSAEINQSSINTIRLLCIFSCERDEFIIPRAHHRFGREGRFVDNTGSEGGGVVAFIETTTGKIKDKGLIREEGKNMRNFIVTKHPDSLAPIAGLIIPGWNEMIRMVLSVLNDLSFLKYAGLDIVITENGFKILEINSLPGLTSLQFEKGFLSDERTKKFFQNV